MSRKDRRATVPASQPAADTAAVEADVAAAAQHLQAGRPQRAEPILTRILKAQPSNPVALHLLGVVALQAGNNAAAIDLVGKAVASKPDYAEAQYTLGGALMSQGKHAAAAACYQKAIALRPDYANAYINLGIARVTQGELDEAVAAFRRAIALAPNVAQVHNNLGSALMSQGKADAALACYRTAIALNHGSAEAHYNLGGALKELGEHADAAASYRQAIALKPGYAQAHNNLGRALRDLGKPGEAVASYQKAIALDPSSAEAHSNLGNALNDLGRPDEAIASHHKAISLRPNFAEAHTNLGFAFMKLGKRGEAVASHQTAIALKPDLATAHYNLGCALISQGMREAARACLRRAIEIEPAHFDAYYVQALVHRFRPGDPEIGKLKELLARDDPSPDQRTRIRFALGKAHDDIGRYAEAFSYFSAANDEIAGRVNFDPTRHRKKMHEVKRAFPERRVCGGDASGDSEHVPVFVVGMSRSGKSLVESLLSEHEHAYGCGESQAWFNAETTVLDKHPIRKPFPECMAFLSDDDVREIGRTYMDYLIGNSPDCRLMINTLPGNYESVGLICRALPRAKIIHCQRDPVDNCLFIYFSQYGTGHDYSYYLRNLAEYYAEHCDLMAHWWKLYGDRMLSVHYEDLVRNPADVGARLYEFCGLDYDPAAVRDGFKTEEIGHWKHYEPYLDTLRQALGELAT